MLKTEVVPSQNQPVQSSSLIKYSSLVPVEAHYTAVDLAKIADQLDQEEAATLAEGVLNPSDLLSFSDRPSANMDDSGYFSVQVCTIYNDMHTLYSSYWTAGKWEYHPGSRRVD